MNKKLVFISIFLIILFATISAEIFLSKQPNQLYTLGENLNIVLGSDGTEGWAKINLACENQTRLLFLNYLIDDQDHNLRFPLTKDFLKGMNGECYLDLIFKNQTKQSLKFTILDHLDIDVNFDSLKIDPNQTIKFSGTAKKPNGVTLEKGFAEVFLDKTDIQIIIPINSDKFEGTLNIPSNIASGDYNLKVFAYEKEGDEITNNGLKNFTLFISQKPTSLDLKIPDEITPGQDLEFKSNLYDQAGKTIDGEQVSLILRDSTREENLNILSKTGDTNYYKVRSNTPLGYMNITAKSNELITTGKVYVNENEQASFDLINDTLLIRNIGNIPYNNFIEILIGNETKVLQLNLTLGESKEFYLEAPDGNYNVSITDGKQNFSNSVSLTGKAISIKSKKSGFTISSRGNLLAWIFVLLVFGLFIFIASKKYIKKDSGLFDKIKKNKLFEKKLEKKDKNYRGGVIKITPSSKLKKPEEENYDATHSLVLSGAKQKSAILALKIKEVSDKENKNSNYPETIEKVKSLIKENSGRVYNSDGYIIGVFAPITTKTFDNSLKAIRTANQISKTLVEHNNKYTSKIKFGLGINSGDIIASKEDGKLLFTPLSNTLTDAKRIAEISDNFLLVSDSSSKEIGSRGKFTSYPARAGIKTYSLKELNDRSQNQKFINSFLERNSEYKKLDDFRFN
jgi:hypothetical protein